MNIVPMEDFMPEYLYLYLYLYLNDKEVVEKIMDVFN